MPVQTRHEGGNLVVVTLRGLVTRPRWKDEVFKAPIDYFESEDPARAWLAA
jgi:hypothetical protein